MAKTKAEQQAQSVELADVWSDPPVEEIGSQTRTLSNKVYLRELATLQIELVKQLEWIKHQGLRVVVIFEGRDAAGKGGAIKTLSLTLNPRFCRVVALGTPTEREKTQWYFQRYVAHLPAAGEMVLFDRSWYNRAGVERVMGFCTEPEYQAFLRDCPEFERMLVHDGVHPGQVLVLGERRRAGAPLPEPPGGPDEALEAEPDGPRVPVPMGRVLQGQGPDVRLHRHQAGALVRGQRGQQEAGAAQHASITC